MCLIPLGLLGVSSAANVPLAGSLDPSFGNGGIVTANLDGASANGIAVQPDGKIVAVGGRDDGFRLARYLADGAPDPSFGNGGYVETNSASSPLSAATAVALQADGKIVVAGTSIEPDTGGSEFAVARYNPHGSLDASFGSGGITTTVIPAPDTGENFPYGVRPDALAILPGGAILAGGSVSWVSSFEYGGGSVFVLARYRPDGSLDPTFGARGLVESGSAGFDSLGGIAVQPDGKIVASGYGDAGGICGPCASPTETMEVWRYEPGGSVDPTFLGGNPAMTDTKLAYQGGPATLQDGKIVVAGYTLRNQPVVERLNANGGIDTTFGKDGFAVIKYATGEPTAVLAQNDGKLLVSATNPSQGQWNTTVVIRLLPDGRLDPRFGTGGFMWLHDQAYALALQPDQKLLAAGGSGNSWVLDRVLGGNNCVVPGLRGRTLAKADVTLKRSYCTRGHISKRFSKRMARGRIISTAPRSGARLPSGATVNLVVSRGKRAY
jgi:uncharacterized delta-60 repeat protein